MIKKLFIVVAVVALTFQAQARNARLTSMGGVNIIDDITRVLWNPANINGFGDQIQGTGYKITTNTTITDPTTGEPATTTNDEFGYGPIIGIKSLGALNLGAYLEPTSDGSTVLRSTFLADALVNFSSTSNLQDKFLAIPHILFGIDLDVVQLGFDLFIETSKYSKKTNNEVVSPADSDELKQSMSNVGGKVSANINAGPISITPLFSLYVPRIGQTTKTVSSGTTSETEMSTSSGLGLSGEIEAGIEVGDANVVAGFGFTMENYQFSADNGTATIKTNEYKNTFLDLYAGIYTKLFSELLFVTQYSVTVWLDKIEQDQPNVSTDDMKDTYIKHAFALGLERPVKALKFLDYIIPRCGISWALSDEKDYSNASSGSTNESTTKSAAKTEFKFTTGFGVQKGVAALDVACDLTSWNGAFTGPSVVSATVTVDFGKNGGGSSYSAPAPKTTYTPAPEVKETPSTETTSDPAADSSIDFDF